jgi:trigger factor
LKEHFILERIAEDEKIDAEEDDYTKEIFLIASQSGESPRKVRARLEKAGSMDVLRNQIIERKVIERILEAAEFNEVPFEFEQQDTASLDQAAGGHGEDIPEAKPESGHPTESVRPEEPPVRE